MSLDQVDLQTLSLFNDRVGKLKGSSYVKFVFSNETGVTFQADKGGPVKIERQKPEQESIDAFVLTFRCFIQKNDPIALVNISGIYKKLDTNNQNKTLFEKLYTELNDYLDSSSEPTINENGQDLVKREILDTIIYGEMSHLDKKKRQKYLSWMKNPLFGALIENEFIVILASMMNAFSLIQEINDQVIIDETYRFMVIT